LESVRFVFRKDIPQTHRLQQILATLVSKYHVGADTILLFGIKHPAKVIPIAGTVNATRIQSLMKAVELDLEKKIGLPSGQKAWVKMYLKLSTNCISKKIITKSIK
jgi:predicted oxidoreductase